MGFISRVLYNVFTRLSTMPKLNAYQRKVLHGLMKELLILRDGEKCLKCTKTNALQMSHIYPKGHYRRMEFDPYNLKLLCVGCHLYWWHRNPMEARDWLASVLPNDRLDYLKTRSLVTGGPLPDYNLIKLDLENEIRKLKK